MTPKEIVQEWVKAFNTQNIDKLNELYHPEAINHQVANEPITGRANIMALSPAPAR